MPRRAPEGEPHEALDLVITRTTPFMTPCGVPTPMHQANARVALLLALAFVATGCVGLAQPGPPAEAPTHFRFVELTGRVDYDEDGTGQCGADEPPRVDPANETVRFAGAPEATAPVGALVVATVRDGCETPVWTWASLPQPKGRLTLDVPGFGALALQFDGAHAAVLAEGRPLAPDEPHTMTRTGYALDGSARESIVTLVDHGAWPLAHLLDA